MLGAPDGGAQSTRGGGALRRAFLAVVPPPPVLRWTESLVESARRPDDGLRWTRPDQRHLTLQFLGRVDESNSLTESVGESVRRIARFTLALGGAGAFPAARRASVLWIGVARGGDELAALASAVTAATAALGFESEDRSFRPHVTLARTNRARDVRAAVGRLGTDLAGPPFTVDRVVLFDSDTRPEGAVHTVVANFPLAEAVRTARST